MSKINFDVNYKTIDINGVEIKYYPNDINFISKFSIFFDEYKKVSDEVLKKFQGLDIENLDFESNTFTEITEKGNILVEMFNNLLGEKTYERILSDINPMSPHMTGTPIIIALFNEILPIIGEEAKKNSIELANKLAKYDV